MNAPTSTWTHWFALQARSTLLMVVGLFRLALPAFHRDWVVRESFVYPGRFALHWLDHNLSVYDNEEDGISGDARYIRESSYGPRLRTYVWSALRNPCGNFRWGNSFVGGPFRRWTLGNYYLQAGFRPDNGWPVLSAGRSPAGGFGY
jgi:hypothetical protein